MGFYFLIAIILAVITLITYRLNYTLSCIEKTFLLYLTTLLIRRTANLCRVKFGQLKLQIDKKFVAKNPLEFC
jgi:hypothetical protein